MKGQESVVVSQNNHSCKSMNNFPRKFEPGKWTFRNRDSRSNETQTYLQLDKFYSEKRPQVY